MISINDRIVPQGNFPDNTLMLKDLNNYFTFGAGATITWNYENDSELFALICIRRYAEQFYPDYVDLIMPYCPHARMDRVKNGDDVFTLKYFSEIINSLNFRRVVILDVHSNVASALIDKYRSESPELFISRVIFDIESTTKNSLIAFYPDEGAMKRYSDMVSIRYAFGIKKRDWETGKILGLDVQNQELVKDKNILIIDDICSRGGTFYHSAKKLKELGAKEVYLYVTHCENTILEGELLTSGLIEKVYTTNSIFTKEHEKIEVFEL